MRLGACAFVCGVLATACFSDGSSDDAGSATSGDTDSTGGGGTGAVCMGMTADCDGDPSNGCEADLDRDDANCGACGIACGDGQSCSAGACVGGCADRVFYVAPSGNDTAPGCDPSQPLRTISAAIARARDSSAVGHEIRACAGQYAETVVLDYPVGLMGGYECTTWTRTPLYGFPDFDGANDTLVRPSNDAAVVLTVEGAALDPAVVIDGLSVEGTRDLTAAATVVVRGDARVTMTNNRLVGPFAPDQNRAVAISSGAAPTIRQNAIDGGGIGPMGTQGGSSTGVDVEPTAGAVILEGNQVSAGRGSGGVVGIRLGTTAGLTGAAAVRDNRVDGGASDAIGVGSATVGIQVTPGSGPVELIGNTVDGGIATCDAMESCQQYAIVSEATAAVSLVANRVYGGRGTTPVFRRAVSLQRTAQATVTNNFIHGGDIAIGGRNNAAIQDIDSDGVVVRHNTIVAGFADPTPPVSASWPIIVSGRGMVIDSNLLIGGGDAQWALRMGECTDAFTVDLDTVRGNAFVNFGGILGRVVTPPMPCTSDLDTATVADLIVAIETGFGALTASDGNVIVRADCLGDPDCAAQLPMCPGPSCLGSLFSPWTTADHGVMELLGGGWRLGPNPPCALTQGATTMTVDDGYGLARTAPRSIGAEESDAACQN